MAVIELHSSAKTYCDRVPEKNQWKLDETIDFKHGGVSMHLGAIADAMDEWEGSVAEALGLSIVDVSSVKEKHRDNLKLQTRWALHHWQEKKGLEATYRNLITAFIKAGKTSYAEAVCKVLGACQGEPASVSATSDVIGTSAGSIATHSSTRNQEVTQKRCYGEKEKGILEKNEAKIRQSFGHLMKEVLHILKGKKIDMEEFVTFAEHQFPPEVVRCIPAESEKISTIFRAITSNLLWSYSHYSPLKSIAEEFAKDDTKPLIERYEKELANFYTTTKLADYIALCQDKEEVADPDVPLAPNPVRYDSEYYQKLAIKLGRPVSNETLQYIADIWQAVAQFFLLPSLTALLDRVVAGSLVINWFIPHLFAMQIRVNSTGREAAAFFRAHQVIEVKIGDVCLYRCETTAGDTKLALLTACKEGNVDQVLELLGKLSDFDFSQDGMTALMVASFYGRTDVVELLIKHNADVNARAENGRTALMVASVEGRTDVVQLLLKHNADVNARMENGRTALMLASQEGRTDVVELLISHNAVVNAKREDGWTALMMASMKGRADVVKILIKHNVDVNARETNGRTALMMASFYGSMDVVQLLIKHNADVNARETDGVTALMLTIGKGRTDVMELLIKHNANVNTRAKDGVTALMMASQDGRTDVMELLIKHNADVNARAENGFTALVVATSHGNIGAVKALLEAQADPNFDENETNWTPLFFASKDGHAEIVQLLVKHGAGVDYKDKNGVTASDIARTHNHAEINDLLMPYSRSKETNVLNEDTKQHALSTGKHFQKLFDKQKGSIFSQKFAEIFLPERI